MEISSKQATHVFIKDGDKILVTITDGVIKATGGLSVEILRPEREYETIEEIAAITGEVLIPR